MKTTQLEDSLYCFLLIIKSYLTQRVLGRHDFQQLMTAVRDAITLYEKARDK